MDLNSIYMILGVLFIISGGMFFCLKNKKFKLVSGIVSCIIIVVTCLISFNPLIGEINYGLDLQGGFE